MATLNFELNGGCPRYTHPRYTPPNALHTLGNPLLTADLQPCGHKVSVGELRHVGRMHDTQWVVRGVEQLHRCSTSPLKRLRKYSTGFV